MKMHKLVWPSLFMLIFVGGSHGGNTTELEARITQLSTSFIDLFKVYYPVMQQHITNETDIILSGVRSLKAPIKTALHDLDLALEQSSPTNFSQRLGMSLAKIELYRMRDGYDQISGDILRYKAKISNFPEIGQQSELLMDAFNASNIAALDKWINDTDLVIAPLLAKHFQGRSLTPNDKLQIDIALKALLSFCTKGRDELSPVFYREMERIQREGFQLELSQRLDSEKALNFLNFIIDFVHNYIKMLATIVYL